MSHIDRFYALRKAEFGYLERLVIQQSVDPQEWSGLQLEIVLRSRTSLRAPRLLLNFEGVKELRVGELRGILFYMIEIDSIADRQLEELNFQVIESEYNLISFQCKGFAVQLEE
jgi:hypothetical protein